MKQITVINKEFVEFLHNRDSAHVDFLTQLPNRRAMYNHYNKLDKNAIVSVFFIDIDDFKKVNDFTISSRRRQPRQPQSHIHSASFPVVSSGKASAPFYSLFKGIMNRSELQ